MLACFWLVCNDYLKGVVVESRKPHHFSNSEVFRDTKYKIRTYDPIRVKDVLYH